MQAFLRFLSYHNAVPIAVSIALLGAGGAFAAANPDAIYSADEQVLTIDNTYIASVDLSAWSPKAEITDVTEDEENYYVTYKLSTINLVNATWRDVVDPRVMKVSKMALGPYRDLGLYVTEQLKQVVDSELSRLRETQEIERRQVSQKTVATIYGGLIGKLLDSSTETLPGYTPVVAGPPASPNQTASAAGSSSSSSSGSSSAGAPIIQVLGKNPSVIPTGTNYADLGAVVSDDKDQNLGIHIFMNEHEVSSVTIDTSTSSEQRIVYRATDTDGHTTEVYRLVVIYDKSKPAPEVEAIPPMQIPEVRAIEQQPATPSTDSSGTQQSQTSSASTSGDGGTTSTSTISSSTTTSATTTTQSASTTAATSTETQPTSATTTQQTTQSASTSPETTPSSTETASSTANTAPAEVASTTPQE